MANRTGQNQDTPPHVPGYYSTVRLEMSTDFCTGTSVKNFAVCSCNLLDSFRHLLESSSQGSATTSISAPLIRGVSLVFSGKGGIVQVHRDPRLLRYTGPAAEVQGCEAHSRPDRPRAIVCRRTVLSRGPLLAQSAWSSVGSTGSFSLAKLYLVVLARVLLNSLNRVLWR